MGYQMAELRKNEVSGYKEGGHQIGFGLTVAQYGEAYSVCLHDECLYLRLIRHAGNAKISLSHQRTKLLHSA